MRELPVVTDLSPKLHKEIGRVIVLHSRLEFALSRIVYTLLGIDPKQGRLAVREPRGQEVVTIIAELAKIAGVKIKTDLSLLRKAVEDVKTRRDQLAHGIWLRDEEGRLFLRVLTGSWQPCPATTGTVKRKVHPQGAEFGLPEVRHIIELIEETISLADALYEEVLAMGRGSSLIEVDR